MSDHDPRDEDARDPCPTSVDTLAAHANAAREHVCAITDAWTTTYDAGDCSPHLDRALY